MIKIAFFFKKDEIKEFFSKNIDYNILGLNVVGFFDKNANGLSKIGEILPDIIITDDVFSEISEDKFVSEIKDKNSWTALIKISESSSINSIRSAFKLGYSDFVLETELSSDYIYDVIAETIKNKVLYMDLEYKKENRREKVLSEYAWKGCDTFKGYNIDASNVYVAAISMLNFDFILRREWEFEKELISFGFRNILNELFAEFGTGEYFFHYYTEIFVFFTPSKIVNKAYVGRAVKKICDSLLRCFDILSFAVIDDECISFTKFNQMSKKYDDYTWFHFAAPKNIYYISEIDSIYVNDFDSAKYLKKYENMLDNLDFDKFVNSIKELAVIRPKMGLLREINEFVTLLYNKFKQLDSNYKVGLINDEDISKLIKSYNIGIAVEYFICCAYAIADCISDDKYISIQIKRYLKAHLADNITLKDISEKFNFEYTYTSKYFYQIMGMSFKKYFNNLRLSTAFNMLKSTDYKCYEIASMVGYNNYEHFSRSFYKKYNKWPKDMIKQNKK